jgi:hypothetical protein
MAGSGWLGQHTRARLIGVGAIAWLGPGLGRRTASGRRGVRRAGLLGWRRARGGGDPPPRGGLQHRTRRSRTESAVDGHAERTRARSADVSGRGHVQRSDRRAPVPVRSNGQRLRLAGAEQIAVRESYPGGTARSRVRAGRPMTAGRQYNFRRMHQAKSRCVEATPPG